MKMRQTNFMNYSNQYTQLGAHTLPTQNSVVIIIIT